MNFKQRLFRYLIGFGIGVVVVFIMFPDHDWLSWTPGKRIMQIVREAEFSTAESAQCELSCLGLNESAVTDMRNQGKVDFKNSDTKSSPKKYLISHGENEFTVLIGTEDTPKVQLVKITGNATCNCP